MTYPYSSFFLDIQLAKRRLERILVEEPGDFLASPEQKTPAIGFHFVTPWASAKRRCLNR
jgi:hypothetical protein